MNVFSKNLLQVSLLTITHKGEQIFATFFADIEREKTTDQKW